jgi:hypothetical protein
MKERPILFSAAMVRAILDGRKTQTRRVAKFVPREAGLDLNFSGLEAGFYCTDVPSSGYVLRSRGGSSGCWNDRTYPLHCPYGKPGDRLWVRETWSPTEDIDGRKLITYRAGGTRLVGADGKSIHHGEHRCAALVLHWRPSIHMPRWASRILLEVTEVRVQRLQEISNEDAAAEGVISCTVPESGCQCNRDAFRCLWDSINAKRGPKHIRRREARGKPTDRWEAKAAAAVSRRSYAWAANPWVWAVTFKKVTEGE